MNHTKDKMKVDLTLRQKIGYYWWVIFWWTPGLMGIIGYLDSKWFTETKGDIRYLLYFVGWTFTIGFIGLVYLNMNLRFKIYKTDLSLSENHDLIMNIVNELKWKQNIIRKHKIIVSDRGYGILSGQIITIIPEDKFIYFNCTHTNSKFTDLSTRRRIIEEFENKWFEKIIMID